MTPTTQPKLTAERILEIIDDAMWFVDDKMGHKQAADIRQARTAVAGIIAERDALKRAIERKDAVLRYASIKGVRLADIRKAIAYTGTEEQA